MITNVTHTMQAATLNDTQLVAASLSGDRQAFGQIVERYQNLVCSIAYNATGSLSHSEDLAQETFLTAWKQLRDLREPNKLRAWLCGIARNLAKNLLRRGQRDATRDAQPLETAPDTASHGPAPSEAVISREEEAILWRSLEQIPELYREPLILFYREQQSIGRVADALELSEDTVKKRLSRGRKMLQEQVSAFVEGALRRSTPGKTFTLGVIAALPALATSATAATIGATAAKGAAVAKSAAGLGLLGAVLGPVLGILGGYLGSRTSIENTKSARERQFMVKLSWVAAGLALLFTVAIGLLTFNAKALLASHPRFFVGAMVCVIMGYMIVLSGFIFWGNSRQQQIRREEAAKLGSPALETENAEQQRGGFEYRSKTSLFGLPLVHVKLGNALGQRRRPALGWIAIGDTAFGIFFAAGGFAVGGLALGGLAIGGVSVAGAAFGALAVGGWAMGLLACGGGAVAWTAAFGGLAVAHDYAVGGLAMAAHANDEAARNLMSHTIFFSAANAALNHARWLVLLAVLPLVLGWRQLKNARKAGGKTNGPTILLLFALMGAVGAQHVFGKPPVTDSVSLTNGIRVVALYFPGSTNVAIFTYSPMSLTSDGPQQSQWAHLIEHLVIRSTVSAESPVANAETLPDHMRLDFYGSTNDWREGLEHQAKWLRGLPFSQANLDAEKPKVKEECDFTAKNFATHKFAMAAWAQGYRHNQSHVAMKGDVLKATLGEIQKCRDERLVVLSNVLVCAVGGVEPAELLPAFTRKLGTLKSGANPVAPVKTHPQNRDLTWDLDARHLVLTWAIASVEKDDYPALLVAAQWLNMELFSDEGLKKLTGMTLAGADLTTPEGNFFFVSASLRPRAAAKEVRERIDRHLERLASDREALALLSMIGKQLSNQLAELIDPGSLQGQLPPNVTLGMLEMNLGLAWGMNEFRYGSQKTALAQKLAAVDANQVRRAARRHLTGDQCTMVAIRPADTEK